MKLDIILNELNRLDIIDEDIDFKEFYYMKLDEWDIKDPDDLDLPCEFISELHEEWLDDMDLDEMIDIFNNIDEDVNLNETFLSELRKIKIKKHSSVADKKKSKMYRKKNKIKLKKKEKKKSRRQQACGEGKVWSVKQNKCVKKAVSVGLSKRKSS